MELRHHKWDAQVGDELALSDASLLVSRSAWSDLARLAEEVFAETRAVEDELLLRPELHGALGLPRALRQVLREGIPTPAAARIMRFDFHWTREGWRLSEVNADVPGGYTETTHWARLVAAEAPGTTVTGDPTKAVVDALCRAAGDGVVVLTCAPGFMEDQQVVMHLANAFRERGQAAEVASLGQLRWTKGRAGLGAGLLAGREVGAIFRFFQAEWLISHPPESWCCLFVDGHTPVANPGTAALVESKRLPLVWDRLRTPVPTWRRLLPETRELGAAPWASDEGWLIKSAYCNNGDTVSIRSALTASEWRRRSWSARLSPRQWLAQRRFQVLPLASARGALYPCVGVYVIDGSCAGAYGRVTSGPLIDFTARDAAILIYD